MTQGGVLRGVEAKQIHLLQELQRLAVSNWISMGTIGTVLSIARIFVLIFSSLFVVSFFANAKKLLALQTQSQEVSLELFLSRPGVLLAGSPHITE